MNRDCRLRCRRWSTRYSAAPVYRQVPAFAASDRGMLDLLAVNRDGRLAVVELKADEDLHMVLQGLDYWIRVHRAAQSRGGGWFE